MSSHPIDSDYVAAEFNTRKRCQITLIGDIPFQLVKKGFKKEVWQNIYVLRFWFTVETYDH